MKKYELIEESEDIIPANDPGRQILGIDPSVKALYQIRALKDFGGIKAGTLGGYIPSESVLSQDGNCWIDETSMVISNNARIEGNAIVEKGSILKDNAIAKDNAVLIQSTLEDNSMVSGDAKVINVGLYADHHYNQGEVHTSKYKYAGPIYEFPEEWGVEPIGRVVATVDLPSIGVSKGELGGMVGIPSESLSFHGNDWVQPNDFVPSPVPEHLSEDIKQQLPLYYEAIIDHNAKWVASYEETKDISQSHIDVKSLYENQQLSNLSSALEDLQGAELTR